MMQICLANEWCLMFQSGKKVNNVGSNVQSLIDDQGLLPAGRLSDQLCRNVSTLTSIIIHSVYPEHHRCFVIHFSPLCREIYIIPCIEDRIPLVQYHAIINPTLRSVEKSDVRRRAVGKHRNMGPYTVSDVTLRRLVNPF